MKVQIIKIFLLEGINKAPWNIFFQEVLQRHVGYENLMKTLREIQETKQLMKEYHAEIAAAMVEVLVNDF